MAIPNSYPKKKKSKRCEALILLLIDVTFGVLICYIQGCQYRTGGCTSLASGTIYFGYRSIPVYRFGITANIYIYIYVYKILK